MFIKSEVTSFGVEIDYVGIVIPASMAGDWYGIDNYVKQFLPITLEDFNGSITSKDANGNLSVLIPCTKPQSDEEFYGSE